MMNGSVNKKIKLFKIIPKIKYEKLNLKKITLFEKNYI